MAEKQGSVIGGILLIAGSCIGAGMLALPIQTGLSGFFPSLFMFFIAWAFMTTTALLIVEVNGWFSQKVNLLTMSEQTLGKIGKSICWITYLFLFYALLVAYISGSGSLLTTICHNAFSLRIPIWIGSFFFVILFGAVVYLGTRGVDLFNRVLMFAKIGFFLLFVLVGVHYLRPTLLLRTDPHYITASLPLLVIAFGFHNVIPSLTSYLNGDLKRVRLTIIGGSLMCFAIYLIFEVIVLGIIPLYGSNGLIDNLAKDQEASQAIATIIGSAWVRTFAQGLGFFALLTSFLAQTLSLVHFLSDGMKITYKQRENIWICTLALLPPLIFSFIYPNLFFKALNFAGGVCAVILFGLLPAGMVWMGRYRKQIPSSYSVPGGKGALIVVVFFSLLILFVQLSAMWK
jgi:tyrosine-specific transport protein